MVIKKVSAKLRRRPDRQFYDICLEIDSILPAILFVFSPPSSSVTWYVEVIRYNSFPARVFKRENFLNVFGKRKRKSNMRQGSWSKIAPSIADIGD